jgi:eukaryotic-like serine/threonine-protein kinase
VLHQIGIGTLGPVFRTYEPTRDRLVAVKVFRLDIVPEQAQVLADTLTRATEASLLHPSIVEPIASGVEGTLAYRAEEYVAAESLDVAMRHYAPAPIDKALPFITQLAGAIDFARAAGVGHGGLHPRDIFVTPDEARATGFGVVEALEEVGIRAPIRRPYTAPERIEGGPWGTPADVFSLAAITFELLTGRRPAGTGAQAGSLPEGARSEAMQAVLARAMDQDPDRRYGSALGFAGALESAARGEAEGSAIAEGAVITPRVAAIPAPPAAIAPPPAEVVAPPVAVPAPAPLEPLAVVEPDAPVVQGFRSAPVPGEFEIEEELDHAVLDEVAAVPTLFDDDDEGAHKIELEPKPTFEPETDDFALDTSDQRDAEVRPFAQEFVDEEEDEKEALTAAPIEDRSVPEPVYAAEEPMFSASGPEPDHYEPPEPARSPFLPVALGVVLGMLLAFPAGYFLGSRDRLVPATESAAAATQEKPGQYSEQKVTTPPVTQPPPAVTTPPPATAPSRAPAAAPVPAPARPPVTAPAIRPAAPESATPARADRLAGHLVVKSTPSRAHVTVNGQWRGRTPLTLDALPFGNYVVRVVQDGYETTREEVTLTVRDASRTIDARLEPKARAGAPAPAAGPPANLTGSLYVDSRPQGADVVLDGRNVGKTPLNLTEVPVGTHVVRIEMAGKKPWTVSQNVTTGKIARVTGSLEDR